MKKKAEEAINAFSKKVAEFNNCPKNLDRKRSRNAYFARSPVKNIQGYQFFLKQLSENSVQLKKEFTCYNASDLNFKGPFEQLKDLVSLTPN